MPSEKQIQAAAKAMETLALERGFVPWDEAASVALTAAEQAEPVADAEAVAWLHEIKEPDGERYMLSRSSENPWSHWTEMHRKQCTYSASPLYTHPSRSEARLREAAREAVNCITHYAEDNENTRWVLSLLNAALKEASDERA